MKFRLSTILLLVFTSVLYPQAADTTQYPASPLGTKLRHLFGFINSNDSAAIDRFVNENISESGKALRPLNTYRSIFQKLRIYGKHVTVVDFFSVREYEIWMKVKTSTGLWADFAVSTDDRATGKFNDAGFYPKMSPEQQRLMVLPNSPGSDSLIKTNIDNLVRVAAAKDLFSGVVLIARKGKIIDHNAFGFADRSWKIPNRRDTKFHIASAGKMFTGVAVAQLAAEGKLRFTDTLASLLPDYPNSDAAKKITVDQLLTHRAGLGELFNRPRFDKRKDYTSCSELLDCFAGEPLLFQPGTSVAYSNEGYEVLGAVVEKISGMTFQDYVRKNIFEKAGMTNSGFFAADEVIPNKATGYLRPEDDPFGVEKKRANYFSIGLRGSASGGEYSTAEDLFKFLSAMRNGSLLPKNYVSMTTDPQGGRSDYGYGFMITAVNSKKIFGHSGGGPNHGINVDAFTFADGSYDVVIMSNYDAPSADLLFEKIAGYLSIQK
jgi:CubicO group peptidase (beta-lactamase class C family)